MKKKVFAFSVLPALLMGCFLFSSCSEPKEVEKITFLEKRNYTAEDSVIDLYPREKGEAHGGSYFSRTDSSRNYGIGTTFAINDSCINKDLRVKFNVWVRSNQAAPQAVYAIALHDGDKVTSWHEVKFDKYIKETNKWLNITDSITIPANAINKPGLIIKTFTFNTQKQLIVDSDDLELTFSNVRKEIEQ
jgi:hypothetical protein